MSASMFSALTDPPYRMRTPSAASPKRSRSLRRQNATVSWACSGVGVTPVPMAQMGS